jgi:nitroimidazol reductase NimA-like FMN-containing flavoprotein (pyridoxamine 5'-phosphate oxidase superfamily)
MRRKDREITNVNDKIAIISECKVCRLGLSENNYPYIVPVNYGYTYIMEVEEFTGKQKTQR